LGRRPWRDRSDRLPKGCPIRLTLALLDVESPATDGSGTRFASWNSSAGPLFLPHDNDRASSGHPKGTGCKSDSATLAI